MNISGACGISATWRDTHVRMLGPVVRQLQRVFAEDWFYAVGEDLTKADLFPLPDETGPLTAQVVSGGPTGEMRTFHSLMFAAINEAREKVTLATSFFVPTDPLVTALETAALRGVDVRLLLAGKSEHRWTVHAGRSYYDTLLNSGVRIYEYRRGIQHAKTLTVDGCWSLVGSPNFDLRSLILNFEVGVAVYDAAFAAELECHFAADLSMRRAAAGRVVAPPAAARARRELLPVVLSGDVVFRRRLPRSRWPSG